MVKKKVSTKASHKLPADLLKILNSNPKVLSKWGNLTPIAKNEWICWVTIVRKSETREEHMKRLCEDLLNGKRRPCCWPGCPHRKPNAKKWFN